MLDLTWKMARPLLFSMDAERAHRLVIKGLSMVPAGRILGSAPNQAIEVAGLTLKGPVGLAAGLDKDGEAVTLWPHLGFGFVEIGTVTAHSQPGNPKPRLFRLKAEGGIINRMGFNNHGAEALAHRLRILRERDRWPTVPVGANIGKSKITPLEEAEQDYLVSVGLLAELVDYITVNVSSPNTPGLRELQKPERLERLLGAIVPKAMDRPVFVKFAPDFEPDAVAGSVEAALRAGVAGVIATNTTNERPGSTGRLGETGGLSGAPLWPMAKERIGTVLEVVSDRVPVIGVGGVHTAEQVQTLLSMGCVAVQLYSGLIFEGPGLIHRLNAGVELG